MIVEAAASVWPPTIMRYHELSFILSLFKFFVIVNDSFCRLTRRMIMIVRRESTIIDYHAPFDQVFSFRCIMEVRFLSQVFNISRSQFLLDYYLTIWIMRSRLLSPSKWRGGSYHTEIEREYLSLCLSSLVNTGCSKLNRNPFHRHFENAKKQPPLCQLPQGAKLLTI